MTDPARRPPVSAAGYLDYDYDRFYTASDFDYDRRVEAAFLRTILCRLARLPPGASIVDLGCGTGFDTWLLDRMGFRATGADVSHVAIDKARRRDGSARFVLADALTATEEIGRDFDLAYCSGFMAFNWVPGLQDPVAIQTARTLLEYVRPGGWLAFIWDSILSGRRWSPYLDLAPERMFMNYTVLQIRQLWESAGGCRVCHAGATHKRLSPLLGRFAFSPIIDRLLTPLARTTLRPVQVVTLVQRNH